LERLLAIYLNDHLAGAMLGIELARRLRSSNSGDAEMGAPLAAICSEIEADRDALEWAMELAGVRRGRCKPALAWGAEKLGRMKLNGRLRGYSPLSRLLELEALYLGITGKVQLWRALETAFGSGLDGLDFGQLAERAASQRSRVGELHRIAAARALRAA
jgi:hypothetical protein